MSAIPATSGTYRSRVDGTIVLSIEIEPSNRQAALALFGSPGTPVAIAALKTGYAAVAEPDPPKEPVGPLCKWLVMRCAEPEFWRFLESEVTDGYPVKDEKYAGQVVKDFLGIESRKEVDTDEAAEKQFHDFVRVPFQRWLIRRQG